MRGFELLFILLICVALCGFCCDCNLTLYFGKDIPWYCDCLVGFFTAPLTVPAAIVGCALAFGGVATPFF